MMRKQIPKGPSRLKERGSVKAAWKTTWLLLRCSCDLAGTKDQRVNVAYVGMIASKQVSVEDRPRWMHRIMSLSCGQVNTVGCGGNSAGAAASPFINKQAGSSRRDGIAFQSTPKLANFSLHLCVGIAITVAIGFSTHISDCCCLINECRNGNGFEPPVHVPLPNGVGTHLPRSFPPSLRHAAGRRERVPSLASAHFPRPCPRAATRMFPGLVGPVKFARASNLINLTPHTPVMSPPEHAC